MHACVSNATGAANQLAKMLGEASPSLLLAKDDTGCSVLARAAGRAIDPLLIEWLIGRIGEDAQKEDLHAARAAVLNHHGVVQCVIKAYSSDSLTSPEVSRQTSAQVSLYTCICPLSV